MAKERGRGPLAVLVLTAVALSGCIAGPATQVPASNLQDVPAPELRRLLFFEDPAGDVREYSTNALATLPYKCRIAGERAWDACDTHATPLLAATPGGAGGVAGPPALDGLAVEFAEGPGTLTVDLRISRLDESMSGAVSPDGTKWGLWAVCWVSEGEPQCVYLTAGMVGGKLAAYAEYDRYSEKCLDWGSFGWCSWRVDYELRYGEPAVLSLSIPKGLLPGSDSVRTLGSPSFQITTEPPLRFGGPAGYLQWRLSGPVEEFGGHDAAHNEYSADWGPSQESVELSVNKESWRAGPAGARFKDSPADGPGSRLEAEILEVVLLETGESFTVATRLSEVRASPSDHEFGVTIGLPSARPLEAGYAAHSGQVAGFARACRDPECSRWIALPVGLSRDPGSPGWVNFTFERTLLESPRAGDLLRLLMVYTNVPDSSESRGLGPVGVEFRAGLSGDLTFGGPYWFSH